ncbi:MAG: response regulator [Lachnospiraceae bacterium]|nr:response regulator [Lachnospiraceae bacterium]
MNSIAELIKKGLHKVTGKRQESKEQSRKEIEGEYFDLFLLLCEEADALGEICIRREIDAAFDMAWGTPKQLYGNVKQIKKLLSELSGKAAEHTDKGKIVFGLSFEKKENEEDRVMLTFSIMCTGDGISGQDLSELNELFKAEGCSLMTEAVPDLGAKYYFTLETGVAAWEPLGSFEKAYNEDLRKRMTIREKFICPEACILIVDDNPMNLEVIKSLLETTKIKIDTAESGDEGIAKAAEKKYDLIFLDHMMPDKDGIETLREMCGEEGKKDTVMVCLTANAISGAKRWYLSEGFDDYLAKPVSAERMEEILLKYLPDEKVIMGTEVYNG